jgi:hypothetical protein
LCLASLHRTYDLPNCANDPFMLRNGHVIAGFRNKMLSVSTNGGPIRAAFNISCSSVTVGGRSDRRVAEFARNDDVIDAIRKA